MKNEKCFDSHFEIDVKQTTVNEIVKTNSNSQVSGCTMNMRFKIELVTFQDILYVQKKTQVTFRQNPYLAEVASL